MDRFRVRKPSVVRVRFSSEKRNQRTSCDQSHTSSILTALPACRSRGYAAFTRLASILTLVAAFVDRRLTLCGNAKRRNLQTSTSLHLATDVELAKGDDFACLRLSISSRPIQTHARDRAQTRRRPLRSAPAVRFSVARTRSSPARSRGSPGAGRVSPGEAVRTRSVARGSRRGVVNPRTRARRGGPRTVARRGRRRPRNAISTT